MGRHGEIGPGAAWRVHVGERERHGGARGARQGLCHADYRTAATTTGPASATGTFRPNLSMGGTYDLYAWFPTISKGAPATPFLITAAGTNLTVTISQSSGSAGWQLLASGVNFAQGTNGFVRVANNTGQGGKNVVADAFRWVYSPIRIWPSHWPLLEDEHRSLAAVSSCHGNA